MFGTLVLIICIGCVFSAIVAWWTSRSLIKSMKASYKARVQASASAAAENHLANSDEPLHYKKIQAASESFAGKTASFISNTLDTPHR